MKVKRAVELTRQLTDSLKDAFSATYCYESTLTDHIDRVKRQVTETDHYKRLPQWAKAQIRGAESILWDSLYANRFDNLPPLCYVKIGPDGRKFGPSDDTWLSESSDYKSSLTGVHVWAKAWEKGQFKPW